MRREWLGEAAGTFLLVFLGTGAVMASAAHPVEVPHGWVSLAFGLAVFACIEAFGPVSGAHLNPAEFASWLRGSPSATAGFHPSAGA
jgi:aquaporin Z